MGRSNFNCRISNFYPNSDGMLLLNAFRAPQHRRSACQMIDPRGREAEDAERERKFRSLYADEDTGPCREDMSHMHVEMDDDGEPEQTRFVYVDEHSCIGCTYCSQVARSTFFMEDDHGRARVYNQGGDTNDLVLEAIVSAVRIKPKASRRQPLPTCTCAGMCVCACTACAPSSVRPCDYLKPMVKRAGLGRGRTRVRSTASTTSRTRTW